MRDILRIRGGKPLEGNTTVSGSKNASLPILAASLLLDECQLSNLPGIHDVETMLALLNHCGAQLKREKDAVSIANAQLKPACIAAELASKMRASYYLIGPFLGRFGEAALPLPGGCNLGSRPVDYILHALKPLGISSKVEGEQLIVSGAPKGGRVVLDPVYRSPGATFTVIMAAVLAPGETTIENASGEPDVVNFCEFLNRAEAKIEGAGSSVIQVKGVRKLSSARHRILGDRLEAGTYLLAGAASRGDVTIQGVGAAQLFGFIERLEASGVEITSEARGLRAICRHRPQALADITTAPWPGFPTDLQPPMMAFLACAEGTSQIEEKIFDGRLGHVDELCRMGAEIEIHDRQAVIRGVPRLQGAEVEAQNIRAGASLVVAAVGAEGEAILRGMTHIRRGYDAIEAKLASLGADVRVG